jgi:hypothetical protein
MEPMKPMMIGGAPRAKKYGDSKGKTIEKAKFMKIQLTSRVSRLPRMNESSLFIRVSIFSGIV